MTAAAPDPRGRRLLLAVLALLAVGAALLLWSGSLIWAVHEVRRASPMPSVAYSVTGAVAVPMTLALGIVALAAVLAVLAAGQLGRRIVGITVLAVAVWTGVQLYAWVGADSAEQSTAMVADGTKHSLDSAPDASSIAGPLAIAALFIIAAAAVLLILAAMRMPQMGRKYERPGSRPAPATDDGSARDRDMWNTLDRGEDPTGTA